LFASSGLWKSVLTQAARKQATVLKGNSMRARPMGELHHQRPPLWAFDQGGRVRAFSTMIECWQVPRWRAIARGDQSRAQIYG
jgi:hypothetical protein